MKRILSLALVLTFASSLFAAGLAKDIVKDSLSKGSADEAAAYISEKISTMTEASEKRALFAFLGSLQEQLGLYDKAEKSFVSAAGISAGDAEGMPKRSNEQLVLDAVRCALSGGNYASADRYLNSAVRNSKDNRVQCYIKLYSVWSSLCRAETREDLEEPLALLKAYASVNSMKEVQPAVLITLWYITGENYWANQIKEKFPLSPECSIVKGDSQLLPSPFWYFVPKSGEATPETGTLKETPKTTATAKQITESTPEKNSTATKNRLQLGLFSSEGNASHLVEELKKKGFEAYIESEKKPSGNTYYIVLVDEKDSTTADRLRSSGYECYLVN